MTWTDKSAVVMEIEGKSKGLKGSIQSTGERFPSIKVIHNGDNGTQSVGLDAIEEYAEENDMEVETEKLGDEEDIYSLSPKAQFTEEDFDATVHGSLSLNEVCEAKDVWMGEYFEVLPGAFEPTIYLSEEDDELSILVEYEERKEYFAEPRTPDDLPDDFKKWLVDEVGEEKAQELREHYDLLGDYIQDYCDEKGISWEKFTYPDAVAQEGAYVDLMREDYGFEGGRTHGPFPEHAHYEWSKEVTVDKQELQEMIGTSLESLVEWIAERIIPPTPS